MYMCIRVSRVVNFRELAGTVVALEAKLRNVVSDILQFRSISTSFSAVLMTHERYRCHR